jgi:hypothetical protein
MVSVKCVALLERWSEGRRPTFLPPSGIGAVRRTSTRASSPGVPEVEGCGAGHDEVAVVEEEIQSGQVGRIVA